LLVAPGPGGVNAPIPGDSLVAVAVPPSATQDAQAAYQTAWSQRESGDFAAAVSTSEAALAAIDRALETDLDASRRRDLVELRSKSAAVRDAARHATAAKGKGADKTDKAEQTEKANKEAQPPKA